MKHNLEWFKHKVASVSHWKFKALRREYQKAFGADGWAGEGKFWVLNCFISDADYCRVNRSDEERMNQLAADLDFTPDELNTFLEILEKKCKLIKVIPDNTSVNPDIYIFTEDTQEMLAAVTENRELNAKYKRQERIRKKAQLQMSTLTNGSVSPDNQKSGMKSSISGTDIEQKKKKNIEEEEEEKKNLKEKNGVGSEAAASGGSGTVSNGNGSGSPTNQTNKKGAGVGKEKKGSAQKKEKNPDAEPYWDKLLAVWDGVYMIVKGRSYSWSKKADFKYMKEIVNVLKKDENEWTEENAIAAVNKFFSKASTMKWLRDHFSITNVFSKIDEVLTFNPDIPNLNGTSLVHKDSATYNNAMTMYVEFFKKNNDGLVPMVDEKDELCLCKLIAYLSQLAKSEPEMLRGLQMLFDNWNRVDKYIKPKMELRNIYGNINQIIQQIKKPNNANGLSTSGNGIHEWKANEYNRTFAETYNSISEKLGNYGRKPASAGSDSQT